MTQVAKLQNQNRRPLLRRAFLALSILGFACQGPFPQSTFDYGSETAAGQGNLFILIFGLAVFVFLVVQGGLIYTLIRFRARPGAPDPKHVHGHTTLEIGWTLAPAFVISLIAIPTVSAIWQQPAGAGGDVLQVDVIGHQWWWEFNYPASGVRTANELHIPQGRRVQLNMTSADVIHSFWAPGLSGKRDVILGRTTRLEFTPDSLGTYSGQCAEFCGLSHANMRLVVVVDSAPDFDVWVQAQAAMPAAEDSLSPLAREGLQIFRSPRVPPSHSCLACHWVTGITYGLAGPNLTHVATRTTLFGGTLPNTAENLRRWLRNPADVKPGEGNAMGNGGFIGMPHVELSDEEIEALVAYLGELR